MKLDITRRLEKLEGPSEGLTRVIVRDLGGGRYGERGSGRVYTRAEIERLGNAVLIVETAITAAHRQAAETAITPEQRQAAEWFERERQRLGEELKGGLQ